MDELDPTVTDSRGTEARLAVATAVPETITELELESALAIDEEADEMFDGIDVPVDALAECKHTPTKDPAEGVDDSLAKRESMTFFAHTLPLCGGCDVIFSNHRHRRTVADYLRNSSYYIPEFFF